MRGIRSRGDTTAPYRGTDRRQGSAEGDTLGAGYPLAVGVLAVLFLATLIVARTATLPSAGEQAVRTVLEVAGATLGVVVGLLAIIRWRLSGDASALWAGTGILWFGSVTLAVATVLPLADPDLVDPRIIDAIRAASRWSVLSLLAVGLISPPIDSRVRWLPAVGAALGVTAMLATLILLLPPAATLLAGRGERDFVDGLHIGPVLLTLAWLTLASAYAIAGVRTTQHLHAWLALTFGGLGLAELARLLGGTDAAGLGPETIRLAGLLCGLIGATTILQRGFVEQRDSLLATTLSALTADARLRAERAAAEERAHDARNALTAIDGATHTLERYRERLDSTTRAELAAAVSTEIARLQRLVDVHTNDDQPAPFVVAEALAPIVTSMRATGLVIALDVPSELRALGNWSEFAQVVQNLLENARRYAPGSPVHVGAQRAGRRIEVRVTDHGPGVEPSERERVFDRGERGAAATSTEGSGLGLAIARRLLWEQGGDVWVEDTSGGGATFVVTLPPAE